VAEGRKLAAILAADVVGYSRLAGVDEELILARLRTLRSDLIDPTIAVHGGRVVNRTGDRVLVQFRSVVDAVRCAIEIQFGMTERNAGLPPDKRIEYRIGVHIGDVVEESDGDLMGDGVNIAARLEGIAKPGAICLSEQAYWQVKGRLDLAVMDLGPTRLKNIAEPVHVYSLEAGAPARAKPLKGAARRHRSMIIALAASLAALAAIAAGVWHFPWAGTTAERVAIMVLPFANLSGDSSQNQLAEAVTQGLTDAFSRLTASYPFFKVIAGDTAKAYADKPIDVKQIGNDLGLRYLLRGSVQPAETHVRVSAQLIDGESGVQRWAETFDEDRAAPLQMEDEIVARIMRALAMRVADIEAERASTARPRNPGARTWRFGALSGRPTTRPSTPRRGRRFSNPAMRRCA
jgi:adenylate cyclase